MGVVGVLLAEAASAAPLPAVGRSSTRSGVCLFLCSREGSDAVDGLCFGALALSTSARRDDS